MSKDIHIVLNFKKFLVKDVKFFLGGRVMKMHVGIMKMFLKLTTLCVFLGE